MEGPKLLLLGAGGLVGRYLAREIARRGFPLLALKRTDLDIRDSDKAAELLGRERPDWLINAAALCNFDACEDNPTASREVNLDAPVALGKICRDLGIRMCQFSSDYVFSGEQREPYGENDRREPQSVYGLHKTELEKAFERHEEHLVPRLSWVFGVAGHTFMSLLPRLLMTQARLRVAAGKRGSCLYAGEGARMIVDLLVARAGGIVNTVHAGEAAWEWFARECDEGLRRKGLKPICDQIEEVPFGEMPVLKPGRPAYSVLDPARLSRLLGRPPLHWKAGTEEFLEEWMTSEGVACDTGVNVRRVTPP